MPPRNVCAEPPKRSVTPPVPTPSRPQSPSSIEVHSPALRYLRLRCELTMREVAEVAGVSASFVNRLELGHSTRVSVTVFRGLRTALGLSAEDRAVLMANPRGDDQVLT